MLRGVVTRSSTADTADRGLTMRSESSKHGADGAVRARGAGKAAAPRHLWGGALLARLVVATAFAAAVAVVLALLGTAPAHAVAPAAVEETLPETTTSDPLPTVQIDGIVWAQDANESTVFAGGMFSNARPAGSPAGQNQTPRSNLLAYDLQSGNLVPSWDPVVNGRVLALELSPDGSWLYVGGAFTSVDGQSRYRLAALDTETGELIASWKPAANTVVQDIVATDSTVYVVGEFSNIDGVARTGVAALSAQSGEVLDFEATLAGGYGVRAAVLSPDESKLVIAGSFTSTNGSTNPGRGMAALDVQTGQSLPWAVNSVIRNAGNNAAVYSLASDGDSVYGTGYDFYGGSEDGFEGAFRADWDTGEMVWMEDCHGDSYSVHPYEGAVYVATHAHYCGNIGEFPQLNPWYINHSLAFDKNVSDRKITPDIHGYRSFTGNPAGRLLHWYPIWVTGTASGVGQAAWDIESSGDYLLYAGEFKAVNGVQQQGLVRFAKSGTVQPKMGPSIKGGAYKIGVQSMAPGQVRVSWDANYDPDDAELTYEVLRRGESEPRYTTTSSSTYWVRDKMAFVDRNVTAGQSYDYRVRVTDPSGNWTHSDWTPVTVSSDGVVTTYNESVLDSEPTHYWPLGESSGRTAFDWAGVNDLALSQNASRGSSGHVQVGGESSSATTFTGSNSFGASATSEPAADVFSVEAWFRTTSTSGGKIAGFGNSSTGNSSSYDRHLYLNGSGRVTFGVYPGETKTLSSDPGLNDGEWHYVVGTLGPDGMDLYVDGERVGQDTQTSSGQDYKGYWRVGGDQLSGWPNTGSSNYLAGQIADVAVYDKALSLGQVDSHWVASGRTSSITGLPVAAFTSTVDGAEVAFDASSSSDEDGPLTGYSWSFGDGTTGEGETVLHAYDAPGTYDVTLMVTDSDGLTASTSDTVVIEAQNSAPTASFSSETDDLRLTVDGSGSSDAEGPVASYAWDFGDGSVADGVTASHEYAEAGTYEVSLTVTDSEGATDTVTQSVTVEAAPEEPADEVVVAEDDFDRSESNGWGSAEEGGAWSVTGGSAAFSVEDGVGKVALAPSHSRDVQLADVDALSTTTEVTFSSSEAMSGGASSLSVFARTVGDQSYSGRVRFEPDGRLRLYLIRGQEGLSSVLLPGEYVPGEKLSLKLSVQGASPTTLALKVWRADETEPAGWQLETTDSTPALQVSGSSKMRIALSSTSDVSTEFRFYHFLITAEAEAPGA